MAANSAVITEIFAKNALLRVRDVTVGGEDSYSCRIFFIDGMTDGEFLSDAVIRPLVNSRADDGVSPGERIDYISKRVLYANELDSADNFADLLRSLMYGDSVLLTDGCATALIIDAKGWGTRGISEPGDERIMQGPREGFEEAALKNLAMLRRKLLTPDLCYENVRVGRRTDTQVFICYINSIVDKRALAELKTRINDIDIDGILDVNYINELLCGGKRLPSLLKTAGSTERPDIVAARLLEGRIAVIVDGTPVVLTLPYLFSENFQSDDDYYLNFLVASSARLLRYVCFFLSVFTPAVYVALTVFHRSLLPSSFLLSVATARGGVAFGSYAECLLLIFIFEILKETGIRMPQSVGHALSIVGGLVVGQAAVDAGLVSSPMLIAVALSGIAGLMIPRMRGIIFYSRIALVIIASLFGLYGCFLGLALLLIRILTLKSFGTDYTVSLLDPTSQGLKDSMWRSSWSKMKYRPHDISKNRMRKD